MKRAFWVLTAGAIGSALMAVSLSLKEDALESKGGSPVVAHADAPSLVVSEAKAGELR